MSVHTDVGDPSARPHELGAQLERLRRADRLDRDVGTEPVSELHDGLDCGAAAVIDRHVGAERARPLEACVVEVDRDDVRRRVELRREHGGEPDRSRADDCDRVARARRGR